MGCIFLFLLFMQLNREGALGCFWIDKFHFGAEIGLYIVG